MASILRKSYGVAQRAGTAVWQFNENSYYKGRIFVIGPPRWPTRTVPAGSKTRNIARTIKTIYNLPMCWSFAIINGRLAEVYFDTTKGEPKFRGHCYVKRSDYTHKTELKQIDQDTKTTRLRYYRKKYTSLQGLTS